MKAYRLMFLFLVLLSSCAHPIHKEFDVYLKDHPVELQKIEKEAGYTIDEATKNMVYEFRSFTTGIANVWVINVGELLKSYLDTTLSGSFKLLKEDISKSAPVHMHFKVNSYKFENFQAIIDLQINVYKGDVLVLDKKYVGVGQGQAGKMFWGGAFAQRHAVHQSSQLAFNSIMKEFLADFSEILKN